MSLFGNNPQETDARIMREEQDFMQKQQAMNVAERADEQVFLRQQEENKDLIKWQQQLGDELEDLKHDLKREHFDGEKWIPQRITVRNKTGGFVEKDMPPLLNDSGIKMIESIVRPLLSRNMINSNLDQKMVLGICRRTSDAIVNNIAHYGDEYELEFGNYDLLHRLINDVIIPAPFRALNDGERKHLRTMNKRVEAYSQNPSEDNKKKKMFFW